MHGTQAKCRALKRKKGSSFLLFFLCVCCFLQAFNEAGPLTRGGLKESRSSVTVAVTALCVDWVWGYLVCEKNRMVSVQTRKDTRTVTMASSPPALPGFGISGKSFLIDHLLQSAAGPEGSSSSCSSSSSSRSGRSGSCGAGGAAAGERLGHALCRSPRRIWGPQHCLQLQHQAPGWPLQQVKDLGRHLLPHSGKARNGLGFYNQHDNEVWCVTMCPCVGYSCPYTLELGWIGLFVNQPTN